MERGLETRAIAMYYQHPLTLDTIKEFASKIQTALPDDQTVVTEPALSVHTDANGTNYLYFECLVEKK